MKVTTFEKESTAFPNCRLHQSTQDQHILRICFMEPEDLPLRSALTEEF